MSSALAGIRKSPAAPLLPGHAEHGLVGFQLCGRRVVCGRCRASILAGLALMQGYASPLRSPGPSFPSAVIFRSFTRSDFAVSPSNSRQPCASGCGFPCALASPPYRPAFMEARHRPVSQNMRLWRIRECLLLHLLYTLEPGINTTVEASLAAGL